MSIAMTNHEHDDNLVDPKDACPTCGERDQDRLVWNDDEQIECARCGTVYLPRQRQEGGDDGHTQ